MQPPRILVIGGGIAGLTTAFRLTRHAPDLAVTLVERDGRLGGKIRTERPDGFVIEGGPDIFLGAKPAGVALCRDLGLADRLVGTNKAVRGSYIMRAGQLYPLPEGLTGLIPARLAPMLGTRLISMTGKLRMALEPILPPRRDEGDETLGGFLRRRFGAEVFDHLLEPLVSGIYAGDADELSLQATFPQLRQYEQEHGSLLRGILAARRQAKKRAGKAGDGAAATRSLQAGFLTLPGGLAEITEALESRLEGRAELLRGTGALRVERGGEGSGREGAAELRVVLEDGRGLDADAVVVAAPAFLAADMVAGLDAPLADVLRQIRYVSTATVSLAYPRGDVPRPLDAYGYTVPRVEARPVHACTWSSTKVPGRAPAGWALLRAFVGRAGREELLERDDDGLVALARDEARAVLGVTAPPHIVQVNRWLRAMPQYTLGHLERVARVDARLAGVPGLFLAGAAYRGPGIPDCIRSGDDAAAAALRFLGYGAAAAGSATTTSTRAG